MTTRKSAEEKEAYVKVYDMDRLSDGLVDLREDLKNLRKDIAKRDEDYVTNKDLELRMSKADQVVKFFWWVAGAVGMLALGTLYQIFINSLRV